METQHTVELNLTDEYTDMKCAECTWHYRLLKDGSLETIGTGISADMREYFAYLQEHGLRAELLAELEKLPTHSGGTGGIKMVDIEATAFDDDNLDIWRDALNQ